MQIAGEYPDLSPESVAVLGFFGKVHREAGLSSPVVVRVPVFAPLLYNTNTMKITRSAFAKAVAKQLAPGKRLNSAEVQKTLQKMGVDPRFKGEVKEYQLKDAFETLKEKGLLKSSAVTTGHYVFNESVKKEAHQEANPGLSKEKQLAHSKSVLRQRLDEEAIKKLRITEALNGAQKGAKEGTKQTPSHTSGKSSAPPAMAKAPIARVNEQGSAASTRRTDVQDILVERPSLSAAWDGPPQAEEQTVTRSHTTPPVSQDQRTQEPPDMFGPEE